MHDRSKPLSGLVRGVILTAIALLICAGLFGYNRYMFLSRNAGAGRPVCMDDLSVASEEAVLRQGIWIYLQERPDLVMVAQGRSDSDRRRNYKRPNPELPIDKLAVDSFLAEQPECCSVKSNWRMHDQIGLGRTFLIIREPNIAWVTVVDKTHRSPEGNQIYTHGYKVDACWKNVRDGSRLSVD